MDIIKKLDPRNNKLVANTGWIIFDKVFHMLLSLFIMAATTRHLTTEEYGFLNYGLSFVNIFTCVCKLGIDAILVSEITKAKENTSKYIGTTIVLRMISAVLAIFITGAAVCVLKPDNKVVLYIAIIQSFSLLFIAFDTIDFYYQSELKSKYTAISRTIAYVFVSLVRVVLLITKAGVIYFAIATVVDALVIAICMVIFYKRGSKVKLEWSTDTAKFLMKKAKPFILANMLVVVYTQMDMIMVGYFSTDTEVGYYSVAMIISNMWMFVPQAIIDSSRPLIMGYKLNDQSSYKLRYKQLNQIIIAISILAGIGFTVFASAFVWVLGAGKNMGAVPVLRILIWSRLFSLLGTTRSIWLICEDNSQYVKWFIGLGALMNVVLNTLLIPSYGAAGAAIATLFTEIVGAIVLPTMFKDTRKWYKTIL